MDVRRARQFMLSIAAATPIVAGCSGGESLHIPTSMPFETPVLAAVGYPSDRTALLAPMRAASRAAAADPHIGELVVSDSGAVINLFDPRYDRFRAFGTGLPFAGGMHIDRNGNLYVAAFSVVQEFSGIAPQFTGALPKPTTTYSNGLANPVDVTTDDAGNVFVSDNGGHTISEFAPGSNTIVHQCPLAGAGAGTAVDPHGVVFVAFNSAGTGFGQIAEYAAGLAGCNAAILPPQVEMAGGMQIDRHGDLIIADENAAVVDIVAPPYTAITATIGGFMSPFYLALSRDTAEIFVSDPAAHEVFVDSYPSGAPIAVLGTANGLDEAFGVAVAPAGR